MFDNLSERLERSFKILKGEGRITEINIAETVKDIRKALLEADVNYKTAKQFTDRVKEKALGQNVINAVRPGQLLVKITHDELAELMGGEAQELNLKGSPAVILMSGLQGSGKTTFAAKLANYLQTKKNKRVMLVACDVYRPAAIEQLRVLGEQIKATVYTGENESNPVKKAQDAIAEAKRMGYDVVIVDTAGRLAVDEQMMQEIAAIKEAITPSETLFVVDAMTGQDAVNTAKEFNDRRSSSSVQARRWRRWMSSIPRVWPIVSSVWVTSFPSWSAPKSSTTRRRQDVFPRRSPRTNSTSMISSANWRRSRRWVR